MCVQKDVIIVSMV